MADKTEITEPRVQITKDGLRVISDVTSEKLAKKKLSASAITGLQGCPAAWLSNSFVMPEILEEEPDNAARRGSMFHQVMENFFALDAEERTHEAMRKQVKAVLSSGEYSDLATNREAVLWLRGAVNGYYNMHADADPSEVVIAEIETVTRNGDREIKKGLEIFVVGQIGNAKRQVLGFIDRVKEIDREEGADVSSEVMVEDWKSGAKVKKYNPNSRSKTPEGLAEQRQQMIYAILLEQEHGVKVTGARLIYPVAREVVDVDLTDEKLKARVIKDVEDADAQLDNHIERNLFEYSPGILCSWCPLFNACPAAKSFNHVEKARLAAESQPSVDVLAKGFEFTRRR